MTDAELLKTVKIGMFGSDSGTWRDAQLTVYINEVKQYMIGAGVPSETVNSDASVGCILIGVNDLWNYSGGDVKFSQYFKERVIQLSTSKGGETV